jgi:hypothetical protein
MRVADWLTTRTFELAVPGLDIAAAAGVLASMPDEVLAEAAVLAARVGVEVGDGATVLLALTGRRALPEVRVPKMPSVLVTRHDRIRGGVRRVGRVRGRADA